MTRLSESTVPRFWIAAIAAAITASIFAVACTDPVPRADAPPASLADGAATDEILCPPGWAAGNRAWDAIRWLPLDNGRTTVRLLRFEAERNGGGCAAVPPFSSIVHSADRRVVWEKMWPDDFRADAIRLGWPDGAVDRCKPPHGDWPSHGEFLLSEQCTALRAELFYGTAEAAEEAQLHSDLFISPAVHSWWSASQLAACKEALVTALPLGGTPQVCRTRTPSLVLDWPPGIREGQ